MKKKECSKKISMVLARDAAFALEFLADAHAVSMTTVIETLLISAFLAEMGKTAEEAAKLAEVQQ